MENEEGEVTEMGELQDYETALRVVVHILGEENALKCKNEEGNLEVFMKMYKTLTTKAAQQKKHNPSRTIILDRNCEVLEDPSVATPGSSGRAVDAAATSGPPLD